MPDTKITALTAIGANPIIPATFPIPMVDLTDTSMAASGTTKKVTVNQILGAGGTATLASATITGDLTVDTNTLFVDSANNRVGIGTASPSEALHINRASGNGVFTRFQDAANSNYIGTDNSNFRVINSASQDLLNIQQLGVFAFGDGAGGTRMTLNSTGLGVGGSPTTKLDVLGSGDGELRVRAASDAALIFSETTANKNWKLKPSGGDFYFQYSATAYNSGYSSLLTLTSTGNVGVGVTPSAGRGAIQLSAGVGFPATQVASSDANTLDDYEEGTWTGTLKGSVSDPTVAVTATGKYTKIGRKVFVEITFNAVNTTGASGHITVTGLPFPCGTPINGVGGLSLNTIGTYTGDPYVFLNQGTSVLELYANVSNGAGNTITHNAGAARFMTTSLTYTV